MCVLSPTGALNPAPCQNLARSLSVCFDATFILSARLLGLISPEEHAFFLLALSQSPPRLPSSILGCQRCVGVCCVHRAASVPPRSAQQRTGRESRSSTVIGRTLQGALQQLHVMLCFSVLFQELYKRFWVLIGRTLQGVR